MKHYYYPAVVLLSGALAAEVLFSVLVFFSDLSLYQNLVALNHSGYLIVPNTRIMPTLQQITPALCGGIFFALTAGAGLSLAAFFAFLVCRPSRHPYRLMLIVCPAVLVFFSLELKFNLPVIFVCGLTMAAALFTANRLFPKDEHRRPFLLRLFAGHLITIVAIVLIWTPVVNKDMFISIRDNLLLSNPVGKAVNDFYYTYTLYPAETFKSLDQKLLKTCRIIDDTPPLAPKVRELLIDQDYLPVETDIDPDITVIHNDHRLSFKRFGKKIYTCSADEFIKHKEKILKLISDKTDDCAFLRKITFLSLIAASPLFCYLVMHAFFMVGFFFLKSPRTRLICAFIGCLLIFSLPAVLFYRQADKTIDRSDITGYLTSDNRQDRVAALKMISDEHLNIEQYIDPRRIAESDDAVDRYWLAKTLSNSRSPETRHLILNLLNDPQPNVVCMAFYSLGHRKDGKAADEIIRRIQDSNHWYIQWYAYKALKRLGWTQATPDA